MFNYGPLIKWGVIVSAIVGFCLGLILYGEHRKQIEWDAAVGEQAVQSAENLIKNAQNTAKVEAEHQRQLEIKRKKILALTKEVNAYATSTANKCVESPEFVRTFDALSGMHESSADGVPAAASPTGEPAIPPETRITDVEVLRAYEGAVTELDALWTDYDALRTWVRSSYAIAKEGAGR